jgi:hypothetical protein
MDNPAYIHIGTQRRALHWATHTTIAGIFVVVRFVDDEERVYTMRDFKLNFRPANAGE